MHLGGSDADLDKKADQNARETGIIERDFGIEEWDWPQGVGLYGLVKLQDYYGDKRYETFLKNWYENNLKKGLPSTNINTTAPYLALLNLYRMAEEKNGSRGRVIIARDQAYKTCFSASGSADDSDRLSFLCDKGNIGKTVRTGAGII